jgi:superfamily II DNA or RNA helicase
VGTFDELYANLSEDPRLRGKQFERVCAWFFENDPVYSHELKTIWLWDDWPGRWGGDAGIDLVAEDRNGDLWAIQAKAYDPKYRVSKKDVDKFLAESGREVFTYRMLIATTDLIDRTGERTIQQQEKHSSVFRLNDLRAAAVDWPASPQTLRPAKPRKPVKPRPHQKDAIRDVLKGFGTSDRGQLIMACGTGKTLTGLFITEKLEAQRILVLLPSLSLLKQTLNEWRANCSVEFASLPVCSDETVSSADDEAIAHTSDLGVPVTTDPTMIAEFLRRKSGPLVVFSTYQSSPQIAAAFKQGRVPGFDLIIADEAHRAAGPVSSDFGTVLDPKAIPGGRRLFMTATPRYFTGRVLKAAQDNDFEIASMDDEAKFGTVFHRLSFGEAIERDLLTDYQVAIVAVDDATYQEFAEKGALVTRDGKEIENAASLAGQIGLAKAMRKYDLQRVISFHSRVKRAREFASSMQEVIDWMPARQRPKGRLWSDVATGEMPAGDRYRLLQQLGRLDDAERGLLANARCLSEGVDVPTLDGVAFVDPRRSEVDIVQAVGRAIRKSAAKTVGTIVIPVFVDTAADPEVALESSVFKPVWDVVKALRAHDDELGRQLDELRRELGRKGGKPRLPDKIHIDVPATVGRDFVAAFDVRLVERTTESWEFMFGLLEKYVEVHGDAAVRQGSKFAGFALGDWCGAQRMLQRRGILSETRQTLLGAIPTWSWDPRNDRWDNAIDHLESYRQKHGNCLVPSGYITEDGFPLASWIITQRGLRAQGKLDVERTDRLAAIPGWSWHARETKWEVIFQRLLEYVAVHGNAQVPYEYEEAGVKLGLWVSNQKQRWSTLSEDRKCRLQALAGWEVDVAEARWNTGLQLLIAYIAENGHSLVPQDLVVGGFPLGSWAMTQRQQFRTGRLSDDREQRLAAVPAWEWNQNDAKWETGYRRLLEYAERQGQSPTNSFVESDGYQLGAWCSNQRAAYRRGELSPGRAQRLSDLPFWEWKPPRGPRSRG